MLDIIRSGSQSFWVKIAFGVIILVFVFWGVGSFTDMDTKKVVASVNGDPILIQHFEKAYRDAEEQLLARNRDITREDLKTQQLGRRVLRGLVQQALIRQEVKRMGIGVSPVELRKAVDQMPIFHNDKGQFDPEVYTRVLGQQRSNPAQFERELGEQLLGDKVFELVAAPVWADPDEARRRFDFFAEKRTVDYIFIPAGQFAGKVSVADKEVSEYYAAHKPDFAIPAKVDVEYIRVSPLGVVKPESISEADAKKWYEDNASRFTEKERVHARHILVPLAEDADEAAVKKAEAAMAGIQKELAAGKDFATVADAHNQPNAAGKGGDLGWVERGQMVKPFEDASFALEAGKVSEPVRTQFGLHLIKIDERSPGGVRPFTDKAVARAAAEGLALERGTDRLAEVVDNLIEDNILGRPLPESAAKYGLKAEKSGFLSKAELVARLGLKDAGAQALIDAGGAPVDTALEAGDSYIIARVEKSEPAGTRTLEEVKAGIVNSIRDQKALTMAMEDAASKRRKLAGGPLAGPLRQSLGVKASRPVARDGTLDDFQPNGALTDAIFEAKPQVWLDRAFAVSGKEGAGALLVCVASVQPPAEKEWEGVRQIVENSFTRERQEGLLNLFMQDLASRARIEVLNTDIVDRVNM